MFSNDNGSVRSDTPLSDDPHGQAALLLVESLIHGLCENEILDMKQIIEIAERALDVQGDKAEAADGEVGPMWRSHELLNAITMSLKVDERAPDLG